MCSRIRYAFTDNNQWALSLFQKVNGLCDHLCWKDHLGERLNLGQILHERFIDFSVEQIVREIDVAGAWRAICGHAHGSFDHDWYVLDAAWARCVLADGFGAGYLVKLLEASLTL